MIVKTGSKESKLPDFLIVGAARSATTSLFYYLKNYDEIYMPARKEPWFFSYADNPPNYSSPGAYDVVYKFEDYEALFRAARPDQIIGEASPSYLFTYAAAIRNIKNVYGELYGKLRIIIILRNPAERAYSHFMLHKRGYKEPLDFRKAIEPDTIASRQRDNWDIFYDYTGCSLYYEQVKAYIEEFPHVKVVLYEDLARNPGKTLREICEFLSVDYREDVKLERLNKSGVPKFELLNEIINKSSFLKDFLMAVIPMTVRKRIKHKAYTLNMKPTGISREQLDSLGPFYARDIENLSALLGRDLSIWLEPERTDNSPL